MKKIINAVLLVVMFNMYCFLPAFSAQSIGVKSGIRIPIVVKTQNTSKNVIAGQKMMYCGIKMDNGFVAVGKPATCIDPANWRDEIGQQVSYDNSFEELWKLEAYRMMSGS